MTTGSEISINRGLEGVIVAGTAICDVRGPAGDLAYRGESIDHWVTREFAEVAAAILDLPAFGIQIDLGARLQQLGELSEWEAQFLLAHPTMHPMTLLQSLVPLLASESGKALAEELGVVDERGREALMGVAIAARLPHAIATLIAGKPVAYPAEPDYAKRFLRMLGHGAPSELQLRALTVTQILQLEHSLNAGTFTARVVASTQAQLPAAIAAALGALSGVLHGGADQAAIEMADEVGDADAAAAFVADCLASGRKIMGMGHREYRVMDPRARFVKALAEELAAGTEHAATFATLVAIDRAFGAEMARRNKSVHPNLEFYKGLVYRALGVPDRAFTAMFAMARVFGYVAHVLESRADSRIIRPAARYLGE